MPEFPSLSDTALEAHQSTPSPNEQLFVAAPENALPPTSLEQLPASIQEACGRAGWNRLMPVQSLAIPYLLEGRDIMIQSRTGSGKTGCYLLPMLPALDASVHRVQALVLVPTRELAIQVRAEAETLCRDTGLSSIALYGGSGYKKQLDGLRDGAQIVIGTPGRILDHLLRRSLDINSLSILVFDEADRMLSIGFYPDMKEIQKYLPKRHFHTELFSATYPPYVLRLAAEFMSEPSMLSLSQKEVYVAEVQHYFCSVRSMDKDRALVRIIEVENPSSAIIFCNTKANVHYVCGVLKGFGYNADELSADLSQNQREAVMLRVRQGQVRFLVATDVAARGIDIPEISHVFLYEPPEDHESYIHGAGRTGRAGAAGTVISFVDIMEKLELDRIARHYSLHIEEIKDPSDEEVAAAASIRLMTVLENRYRSLTGLEKTRLRRYVTLAGTLAREQDEEDASEGINLLAMLLDACHQNTLNTLLLPPASVRQAAEQKTGGSSRRRKRRGRGGDAGSGTATEQETPTRDTAENVPSGKASSEQEPGQEGSRHNRSRRRRRHRRSSSEGARPETASAPESAPSTEAGRD